MQQCGFCSMLSGLLRRAMCVGSRRGSSESYYRELGDQDTLKIEDKASDISEDSDDIKPESEVAPFSMDHSSELSNLTLKSLSTGCFLTLHKRRKKRLLTRSLCQEHALLDDLHQGQVQCILKQSMLWKFNAFSLETVSGGRCLPVLCVHLFHIYGLMTHFKLDPVKLWKLFSLIEEGYHSTNPYHNSIHAADVTQAMHCFLQQKQISDYMEPLEVMASLLAAIAHDMDHPGVNQSFLIATSNHLAALYRNTSVLENHHWRSAVSCLLESGIFDDLTELQEKLEHQISSLILATDITRQQEYLSRFKGYLDTNTLDMKKSEHRHLVLQIALKCADISNPCRPWDISRKWSSKVCEEFFRQGDYEKKLNLPVSALCDRHTTSMPKIQTGFFKFVVTPLITEWHRFLQNDLSTQMLANLLNNQGKWEMLVKQEVEEDSRTEISDADLVDDDLETGSGTNMSDSSEPLLPLRRCSLNNTKSGSLKEQLRRFSVPLNVFQDTKFKNRDKSTSSVTEGNNRGDGSLVDSRNSLPSRSSVPGECDHISARIEKLLSKENLVPDSSIASLTTAGQATRLRTVLMEGGTWRLVRQQTFPPLDHMLHTASLDARRLHTSNEEAVFHPIKVDPIFKTDAYKRETRFCYVFKRNDFDKTDNEDTSENKIVDVTEREQRYAEKENVEPPLLVSLGNKKETASVGSQLRDNLTSVQLGVFSADQHMRRRKSMPTETVACMPKEKKSGCLPQVLCRAVGREWWGRRGSAPCELRTTSTRRKPAAAHHWLAKPAFDYANIPRRSSLPVEVYHPDESDTTTAKPRTSLGG